LSIARFTMGSPRPNIIACADRRLNGKPDLRHNGAIAVSELDDYVAEPVRT
jgi:hypothetical protein